MYKVNEACQKIDEGSHFVVYSMNTPFLPLSLPEGKVNEACQKIDEGSHFVVYSVNTPFLPPSLPEGKVK